MQRTVVLEYNGEQIVSQPFCFKHACAIDDKRLFGEGLATAAREGLVKMFEGTVITEEVIESGEVDFKSLREANRKVIDMFLGVDEEVKN